MGQIIVSQVFPWSPWCQWSQWARLDPENPENPDIPMACGLRQFHFVHSLRNYSATGDLVMLIVWDSLLQSTYDSGQWTVDSNHR